MSEASRFNDGKAPDALRTIGEVASALGIRQHVLRYWEEQFPMLNPLKRSGGRRYYRAEDVALVERIDRLVHHEGYTLRGARLALEGKTPPVETIAAPMVTPSSPIEESTFGHRARLVALRHTLATALQES
jgi:DNA-binding transcriptional MerR regulator